MADQNTPAPADLVEAVASAIYLHGPSHKDMAQAAITAMQAYMASELAKPMDLHIALDFADNPRPYHTLQAPADTNGELYRALAVLADAYRRAAAITPQPDPRDAEIERLREALGKIDEGRQHLKGCSDFHCPHPNTARAALAKSEGQ